MTKKITAVLVDSREPDWVKKLDFGAPTIEATMETGDLEVATLDDQVLQIERKTPEDFLSSLKDGRLMAQMARLAEDRHFELIRNGKNHTWPYLVITGSFDVREGKTVTQRGVTGWSFNAVSGALLSIQEMGVFVTFCDGDAAFRDCVVRLAERKRDEFQAILPPRPGQLLGPKISFLVGLPGIGIERAQDVLDWAGNNVAIAMLGLTDVEIKSPVPVSVRWGIRGLLGLAEGQELILSTKGE